MNDLLTIILKDTYSLTQLKHRLAVLKSNLLKSFFGLNPNLPLSKPGLEDLGWLQSLPQSFYQKFTKDNIYQIFSGLESEIAKLQVLVIYLTFDPDETTLGQLSAVSRKTFNLPFLLLDVKLNPDLLAGTALVWKGIYKDYSLRAKIEERKEEILQGFKRFLR